MFRNNDFVLIYKHNFLLIYQSLANFRHTLFGCCSQKALFFEQYPNNTKEGEFNRLLKVNNNQ